jgi:hypothetical protein
MLWYYTTALEDIYGEAQLSGREPRRLSRLRAKAFVYQAAKEKACVCDKCGPFCAKAADRFGMTLALYSVGRSGINLSYRWPPRACQEVLNNVTME